MNFSGKTGRLAVTAAMAILLGGTGCVKTDGTLGQDYIPSSHIWKVATVSFDIDRIDMVKATELGGYSSKRVAIGGVYDNEFGWSERVSAFPLIPVVDTLTFQMPEDAECLSFHFAIGKDTLSFREASQEGIIQCIRVYELSHPLDNDIIYAGRLNFSGTDSDINKYRDDKGNLIELYDPAKGVVTDGCPTYNGGDSLSFNFKKSFGQKYLDALKEMKLGSVTEYAKKLPGVIIRCDRDLGSGRINLFQTAVTTDDYNYLTGNYATMRYRATFDERGPIDTSIVFLLGLSGMIDSATSTLPTQYAFNFSTSQSNPASASAEDLFIEGGCGLKPVIRSIPLKSQIENAISEIVRESIPDYDLMSPDEQKTAMKEKRSQVIVNRATVFMPYQYDAEFTMVEKYPKVLSPTCRISGTRTISDGEGGTIEQDVISFAGLTDASVANENQGDINRSMNRYQPDISHHVQELIRMEETGSPEEYAEKMAKYDIWMLIMHPETTTTSSSGDSSYNDYLNALAYSSYYNNLYGYGGYGYGSYGYGYDSYYNNYYNYMMMAAYASQSSTTTTSSVDLDKDRYYNCHLYGTGTSSAGKRPKLTITFSYPKE